MDECSACGSPASAYCECCFVPLCREHTRLLIRLEEKTLIVCEECKRATDSAPLPRDGEAEALHQE